MWVTLVSSSAYEYKLVNTGEGPLCFFPDLKADEGGFKGTN